MTDTAILRGRQVVGMFASGGNAVVARRTVIHDTSMIKYAGGKTGDAMAHAAILGGGDVRR